MHIPSEAFAPLVLVNVIGLSSLAGERTVSSLNTSTKRPTKRPSGALTPRLARATLRGFQAISRNRPRRTRISRRGQRLSRMVCTAQNGTISNLQAGEQPSKLPTALSALLAGFLSALSWPDCSRNSRSNSWFFPHHANGRARPASLIVIFLKSEIEINRRDKQSAYPSRNMARKAPI
jgi:hypothetical protein